MTTKRPTIASLKKELAKLEKQVNALTGPSSRSEAHATARTQGPGKIQWVFEWKGGGYNTCYARTRTEAAVLAEAMGMPSEYRPGQFTNRLVPNLSTLQEDPDDRITRQYDKRYAGSFD